MNMNALSVLELMYFSRKRSTNYEEAAQIIDFYEHDDSVEEVSL